MNRHPRAVSYRTIAVSAVILAFQTASGPAAGQASDAAYETIKRLGAAMERCWFGSGDAAFSDYAYSPEPNASTGARILIVPRGQPQERPALVIEVSTAKGGANINAYGPLGTSPLAGRIGADLRRWLNGSESCS